MGIKRLYPFLKYSLLSLLLLPLSGCGDSAWNNPYPESQEGDNIMYSSFVERPNHLDPARSYVENEWLLIAQIYEPPFQYHYLKRPYELIPQTATEVPEPVYLDESGKILPDDAAVEDITHSVYDITIRPGIHYQPHPAFAKDEAGNFLYHNLAPEELEDIQDLQDFEHRGSRELVAADYVYQIKRLAHPRLQSPILGVMNNYIVGLEEYAVTVAEAYAAQTEASEGGDVYLDLARYPLEGVSTIDRYTYRIVVRGKYPQLRYWLAMPFFAPVPTEAIRFYSQPGMEQKNLNLDWYPVGTGPYMLTVNDPNRQIVMERNPNYHGERYPSEGEPGDTEQGLLDDAGKPMPFIDKAIFSLERESIPYWNKFLQGYYDRSGIISDSFDQAIQIGSGGDISPSPAMEDKGIKLLTSISTSIAHMGFNMMDPVVGGNSERARKLRQAISIAVDYEEFISIFLNGRAVPAQGPLPPGIFGNLEGREGINPYIYDWMDGEPQRKPIEEARRLLAEAGYPNGRNAETGRPLLLYFDTTLGGPGDKALADWIHKQFRKLNVQLVFRNTDFNRFQEKMREGNAQIWMWGWNADYPDPENFLFLLYGPNSRMGADGMNSANYDNPEFNRLFKQMETMEDSPERQAIINEAVEIARRDSPWIWGYHPKDFILSHAWYHNAKPHQIANNTLKYARIEPELREQLREAWNQPIVWPIALLIGVLIVSAVPAVVTYKRKEREAATA